MEDYQCLWTAVIINAIIDLNKYIRNADHYDSLCSPVNGRALLAKDNDIIEAMEWMTCTHRNWSTGNLDNEWLWDFNFVCHASNVASKDVRDLARTAVAHGIELPIRAPWHSAHNFIKNSRMILEEAIKGDRRDVRVDEFFKKKIAKIGEITAKNKAKKEKEIKDNVVKFE